MKRLAASTLALLLFFVTAHAQQLPSVSEKTDGMSRQQGFFTYYWDEAEGKLWLEVERDMLNREFLYVNALAAGVGSNDIGLDRNQLGGDRVVYFERRGPRLLLVQPNYDYRATSDNPREQASVRDAFARSVLWGFPLAAADDDKVLIDMTDFLMRDAHGVADRLRGQGSYSVDDTRSALYREGTLNFPKNTEFEALLTFTGDASGGQIRSVTPSPDAVSVRQHHSFVQLPDDNYEPRVFDPRAGYFGTSYQDYSTPIAEPLTKRFITRHRLQKKNPGAAMSEPVEPIVYYLDPGTPEPVRSALLEGARWWNQAFEAAGYKDAFQVKMLPEDAHPLDVRYNVINWVHRSTRGWSYGSSVVDPRTGEIIKGHVLLGSLRVRQDYLIAEGLLAPYAGGEGADTWEAADDPMLQMALARIRQLSAHEVGHTLGLAHNFAASTNSRASVMDYPAPMVRIADDGTFDLSEAYDTGIGAWDKVAITYGYQDFPEDADRRAGLEAVIDRAIGDGLQFISDSDARPAGGAHPDAHLWDNGTDAVDQLHHVMEVRRRALDQFSEANIPSGTPMAELEDVLVPVYLYHRYQLDGTAKLIGGLDYTYKVRGDAQGGPTPVVPTRQQAALDAMLQTLSAEALRMPQDIIDLIPPRPIGYYGSRELFNSYTDPAFDALGAAETAAGMTASLLFNPNRAARLVDFDARNDDYLGLGEMIDQVLDATWKADHAQGYEGAVQRTVNYVVLYHLVQLAMDDDAPAQVRAVAGHKLSGLKAWLQDQGAGAGSGNEAWQAAYHYGAQLIDDYQHNPERIESMPEPLSPPPGSPIGSGPSLLNCTF